MTAQKTNSIAKTPEQHTLGALKELHNLFSRFDFEDTNHTRTIFNDYAMVKNPMSLEALSFGQMRTIREAFAPLLNANGKIEPSAITQDNLKKLSQSFYPVARLFPEKIIEQHRENNSEMTCLEASALFEILSNKSQNSKWPAPTKTEAKLDLKDISRFMAHHSTIRSAIFTSAHSADKPESAPSNDLS